MNANCFGAHIDIIAFDTAHFAFAQHSQHAHRGFVGIMQQRVRSRARNERAISQVISVRENFARDLQTVRFAGTRECAVVGRKQNQFRID